MSSALACRTDARGRGTEEQRRGDPAMSKHGTHPRAYVSREQANLRGNSG